jgi:hypothetical protein
VAAPAFAGIAFLAGSGLLVSTFAPGAPGPARWLGAPLPDEVLAASHAASAVVGVDLLPIEPIPGSTLIQADFTDPGVDQQLIEALAAHLAVEIEETEQALRRLDGGHYGTCVRCAKPIGTARLAALPAAACCADCARLVAA